MERAGRWMSSHYAGGVIMVEASKQVFAPTKRGHAARMRNPLRILDGVPSPATGRVRRQKRPLYFADAESLRWAKRGQLGTFAPKLGSKSSPCARFFSFKASHLQKDLVNL